MLRPFINELRRNLLAGLRLALLRPVALLDFRVSVPQFLALAVFGALCASLVDLAGLVEEVVDDRHVDALGELLVVAQVHREVVPDRAVHVDDGLAVGVGDARFRAARR